MPGRTPPKASNEARDQREAGRVIARLARVADRLGLPPVTNPLTAAHFLRTDEARHALKASELARAGRALDRAGRHARRRACSGARIDAHRRGEPYREGGMVASATPTSYGSADLGGDDAEPVPARRWTPSPAVLEEQYLDGLSIRAAEAMTNALPSPSARSLERASEQVRPPRPPRGGG